MLGCMTLITLAKSPFACTVFTNIPHIIQDPLWAHHSDHRCLVVWSPPLGDVHCGKERRPVHVGNLHSEVKIQYFWR